MVVNLAKSQIIPFSTSRIEGIRDILGFRMGCLPITYLGLPLFSKKLTHSMCQDRIWKVRRSVGNQSEDSYLMLLVLFLLSQCFLVYPLTGLWC